MRTALGILTLLLVLAGCGDDPATDPADGARDGTPSGATSPATEVHQVALLSATAAGGEVTEQLTRLPDDVALRAYAARFTSYSLANQIRRTAAATDVPEGEELAAAVVAVGCEKPTAVVAVGADRVRAELPDTQRECLAPVTTVALVLVER